MAETENRPDDATDEVMALAAQAGSHDAFAELMRRYQSPLHGFLRSRLGLAGHSEDLVQEVFLRAYQHLPHYDSRHRFRAWLFTIAYRMGISALRRRRLESRHARQSANAPTITLDDSPSQKAIVTESAENLWMLARRVLPDRQVTLLWLCYVEELDGRELARVMGMTGIGVKVALHRARKVLRNSLPPSGLGAQSSPISPKSTVALASPSPPLVTRRPLAGQRKPPEGRSGPIRSVAVDHRLAAEIRAVGEHL